MVGALAIDTYLPSIPAIGRAFAVGPVAVQQTLSVFLFMFAFMMLFYGTLSDSFGPPSRDPGRVDDVHAGLRRRRAGPHASAGCCCSARCRACRPAPAP